MSAPGTTGRHSTAQYRSSRLRIPEPSRSVFCTAGVACNVTAARLPQQQQAQRVVQLRVGEQHGLQRRGPVAARVQGGEGLDLRPDVGRGVEQEPPRAVGAHGDRRLGAWDAGPGADRACTPGSRSSTAGAAPRRRAQHPQPHADHPCDATGGAGPRSGARRVTRLLLHLGDVHGHLGATPISSNSGVSHTSSWDSMDPPPFCRFSAGSRQGYDSRECEGDQRAAMAGAEHAGEEPLGPSAPADRHDDVLPAVDAVGRRAAVVTASALELPQLLAAAGVDRDELT